MQYTLAIETIREKLADHQVQKLRFKDFRPAGIVMPVFEKNGEAHFLMTQRTDTLAHHKGQVSFPGGGYESQDIDIRATAIRETNEEVGIPGDLIDVIGRLNDFPTISNFMVSPFVATIPYPYPSQPNPEEVARLLEVPFSLFLNDDHFEMKYREVKGKTYPLFFYDFEGTVIWGVTGHIIKRFIEQVFDYNPAPGAVENDSRWI